MGFISCNNWYQSRGFICEPRISEWDRTSTLKTVGSSETSRGAKKLVRAGQVEEYTETSREHSQNSRDQAKTKSEATSSRKPLERAGKLRVGGNKFKRAARGSRST